MTESVSFKPGRIATITFRRPDQRNALDGSMIEAVVAALDVSAKDPECRCVVLAGDGDHFCAGADFAEVAAGAAESRRYGDIFEGLLQAIEQTPLPVLARVHGAALGAGAQILAACDLSVAADDAVIGIPSARLGLLLDLEKIQRMVRVLGVTAAREMLLTGRRWSGREAATRGLVTRAVPDKDLDDSVAELSREIAEAAPLSVSGTKAAIRVVLDRGPLDRSRNPDEYASHDARALAALLSDDLREGLAASRERRPPRFHGS